MIYGINVWQKQAEYRRKGWLSESERVLHAVNAITGFTVES